MRIYLCLFLALFILNGCNTSENKESLRIDSERVVLKNFSDSLSQDSFKVKIIGKELIDQHLVFMINRASGEKIYDITIKAKDLLDNYDATIDLKKKKNQHSFLESELTRFFEEDNFMEPAITENETANKNVPDKIFYQELKDSKLNGFMYRLGKENKVYIGWSAKEQKVKVYYSCCK